MRYRLRTLMIVLTLVACGLGGVAWMLQPSIYVLVGEVDAGPMRPMTEGQTAFEVRNRGLHPIRLERDWTIGKAICVPKQTTVPPGESRRIVLRWEAPMEISDSATKIAQIRLATSDPRRPWITFKIVGRVE